MKRLRKTILNLHQLEARETPATIVNPTTLTYQDVDGDNVTVTLSKPLLTVANAPTIFTFNNAFATAGPQQLQTLNLTSQGVAAIGVSITHSAVRSPLNGGDGFAAVGQIDATGIDLGAVIVDGDLGRILAGDATTNTPGLGTVSVRSLGRFGLSTGAVDLASIVNGPLTSLRVTGDIAGASMTTTGGPDARIGSVSIGGSIFGSDTTAFEGTLVADGDIGDVFVVGDLVGGALSPAKIESLLTIKSVKIGGSIRAGHGLSGAIRAVKEIGKVSLGGSLEGGTADDTGIIASKTLHIKSVAIGGSIIGGVGKNSGTVSPFFDLRKVTVGHDVIGGIGDDSGQISNLGDMGNITIGGSIRGGIGARSGGINSGGKIGKTVVAGNLFGGAGPDSGQIHAANKLLGAKIGGSLIGGVGPKSGSIVGNHDMGPIHVAGDLIGGVGNNSAAILPTTDLTSAKVGGSLRGGGGDFSARIFAPGSSGPIQVTGDLIGQSSFSGSIGVNGVLRSATVGGSMRGGSGSFSASLTIGNADTISIGGDVIGGSASAAVSLQNSGGIQVGGRVKSLTIGGSLIAGNDTTSGIFNNNGAIAGAEFGTILIKGNMVGNPTAAAKITILGAVTPTLTADVALGKLIVLGRVELAQILAGFSVFGDPLSADAQIGSVTVGGDWIASSLVAGATANNALFGDADDAKISGAGIRDQATVSSSIGAVTIGGHALGTLAAGDHFGIVAENVGIVKVGGTVLPTAAAVLNEEFGFGSTGDVKVKEI